MQTVRWRRYLPPIPTEHGAWVMLIAAVATPLTVRIGRDIGQSGQPMLYTLFVVLALLAMFFRAAIRRMSVSQDPVLRRRFRYVSFSEGLGIVLLAGVLASVAGLVWLTTALVIPAVLLDLRMRRHGWPVPLGGELAGIVALSLAVPAGAALLGVGDTATILWLWGLFLAFHVGSILRVQGLVPGAATTDSKLRRVSLGYQVLLVISIITGWYVDILGLGAPLAFSIGGLRTAIGTNGRSMELKQLGRVEGVLSGLFVLASPWLLPL